LNSRWRSDPPSFAREEGWGQCFLHALG